MYERDYGYKYHEVREYAGAAEIAKAIRADIKQAKAEGLLPRDWSYSVRSSNFAGGCAIDVTVNGPREAIIVDEDMTRCPVDGRNGRPMCQPGFHRWAKCEGARHLTELAEVTEMTLKRIHDAYNHDGSESMTDYFDVRYYGQVNFDYSLWRAPANA